MKSRAIRLIETFIVAGDEIAQETSLFHTFPSLMRCSDGTFLCTALVGSKKSGPDGRTRVFKSVDGCRSWVATPSPTGYDEADNPKWGFQMCHIAELSPGHLLAAYLRSERFKPEEALFHPETSGMQHSVVRLTESKDQGESWSEPWDLNYTLPDIIAPGQFVKLSEGTLGLPFEVWHEWEKGWQEGPSTRLLASRDGGKTWSEAGIIAKDETRLHIFGDPRLTRLPNGHLIVLVWVHNIATETDLPVHLSGSTDNGLTWSPLVSTGIIGQIACPIALEENLLLAVYQKRFGPEAGLRAVLSYDSGITWDMDSDTSLWGLGLNTDKQNPFSGYEEYSFGYSSVFKLSAKEFLVSFWISNGITTYIRLLKIGVV